MEQTRGRIGRRHVLRIGLGVLLVAVLVSPVPGWARRQKTVFRSQPVEWSPEVNRDGTAPAITFSPSWTFTGFEAPLAGDPVPCAGLLVAASQGGEVAAIDPAEGREVWRVRLDAPLTVGPAASSSAVFVAAGEGRISALEGGSGGLLWSTLLGSEPALSPRVSGTRLLVPIAAQALVVLDAESGALLARRSLPGRPSTPPEVVDETILIGTDHGMLLALEETTLAVRWRHYAGQAISAPPLVQGGRVYVAARDRSIRSLRLKDGKRRWKSRTGAITTARMFTRGPYLYLLCYDNDIYVLRRRNGHLITRVRLGHRLETSPALTEDHLFVVPFTEAALVGLSLPGLQIAGRYSLDLPGEGFTTAPVVIAGKLALGYGRSAGKVLALTVSRDEKAAAARRPSDS